MARGWESKSVESQMEDARARPDPGAAQKLEPPEVHRKRQSLEMSRRRVLQEIEATRSDARRASLHEALAFLDGEIRKLG
jgi:hypothetical protein